MKESISNSVILGIVLTFFGILILLLASSSAYSKAFKVRNRIIELIEYNQGFENGLESQDELVAKIETELQKYGYRVNTNAAMKPDCKERTGNGFDGDNKVQPLSYASRYNYCVYEYQTDRGNYYGVLTYMYFDIPLVDNIKISVYGETKTLYDLSNF